jgi:carboxyl-terminal processing protease
MPTPPRLRTPVVALLLLVPLVAGGFLLQEPPPRAGAPLFDQVRQLISRQYVDSIGAPDIAARAARGLVNELHDPYTELLSPSESAEFARGTNGRYGGTGMLLGQDADKTITVERVFPNTPAYEAGVTEGDRVVAIGDSTTTDWDLARVSDALRGRPGSRVTVTFARPEVATPIRFTFTRRQVKVPAVPFATVLGGVGYVPLQTFNENANDEVRASVDSILSAGAHGLVIDLRGNGGGIVDQALAISSLFLEDGQEIVRVRSRHAADEVSHADGRHAAAGVPIVLLTDEGTASAAEIVAGALQDHDRALVVGSTSFGKGLVQSVYSLDDGYTLKLTTGKWYTPSGRSIHRERRINDDGSIIAGRLTDGRIADDSVVVSDTADARAGRPQFRSDAGRPVYGGGGIVPDVVVREDTLSTLRREFLRAIAPKTQQLQMVLQRYALEQHPANAGFTMQPATRAELRRRLIAAGVSIDTRFDTVATDMLSHELERRVVRHAFGEGAERQRMLGDDRALQRAIDLLRRSATQQDLLRAGRS